MISPLGDEKAPKPERRHGLSFRSNHSDSEAEIPTWQKMADSIITQLADPLADPAVMIHFTDTVIYLSNPYSTSIGLGRFDISVRRLDEATWSTVTKKKGSASFESLSKSISSASKGLRRKVREIREGV